MIPNLLCRLILRQLCSYRMLNRIVDPSNVLCIVCFSCIYQSSIPFFNILRYHISFTDISLRLLTLKKISHYITPIRIVLPIQPHTHRLKRTISFSSHNQQSQRTRVQKQRKIKYQIAETKQISSQNCTITPKHKTNLQKLNANTKLQKLKGRRNTKIIADTERKYQITEANGKKKYQIL